MPQPQEQAVDGEFCRLYSEISLLTSRGSNSERLSRAVEFSSREDVLEFVNRRYGLIGGLFVRRTGGNSGRYIPIVHAGRSWKILNAANTGVASRLESLEGRGPGDVQSLLAGSQHENGFVLRADALGEADGNDSTPPRFLFVGCYKKSAQVAKALPTELDNLLWAVARPIADLPWVGNRNGLLDGLHLASWHESTVVLIEKPEWPRFQFEKLKMRLGICYFDGTPDGTGYEALAKYPAGSPYHLRFPIIGRREGKPWLLNQDEETRLLNTFARRRQMVEKPDFVRVFDESFRRTSREKELGILLVEESEVSFFLFVYTLLSYWGEQRPRGAEIEKLLYSLLTPGSACRAAMQNQQLISAHGAPTSRLRRLCRWLLRYAPDDLRRRHGQSIPAAANREDQLRFRNDEHARSDLFEFLNVPSLVAELHAVASNSGSSEESATTVLFALAQRFLESWPNLKVDGLQDLARFDLVGHTEVRTPTTGDDGSPICIIGFPIGYGSLTRPRHFFVGTFEFLDDHYRTHPDLFESEVKSIQAMINWAAREHLLVLEAVAGLSKRVVGTLLPEAATKGIRIRRLQMNSETYGIIGESDVVLNLRQRLSQVMPKSIPVVLITGETGTGKELIARALHAGGIRSDKPLVAINSAALPENMLESELFGHVKGGYTGATHSRLGAFRSADGGTIFLDEVGDMSLKLQAELLRVLQVKEVRPVGSEHAYPIKVDVWIIAATNRDLEKAVQAGTFREDLYYRLNGLTFVAPPLRDRLDDLPLLVEYFLEQARKKGEGSDITGLTDAAWECLKEHSWPGNVRELEYAIARAIVLADSPLITNGNLELGFKRSADNCPAVKTSPKGEHVVSDPMLNGARTELVEYWKKLVELGAPPNKQTTGDAGKHYGMDRSKFQRRVKHLFEKNPSLKADPECIDFWNYWISLKKNTR